MQGIFDQARQVLRRLGRAPMFTAITLLTLAIGIGANTVVFSVVDGVLLKPLPYAKPEELVGIWHTAPGIGIENLNMDPSIYFIDREQNTTLVDLGAYTGDSVTITGAGQPEQVRTLDVTDGVLPVLGIRPQLGRVFTRRDDTSGAPDTVVLTDAYWKKKYGGDRAVIGKTLLADGKPREIIGVLPQGFQFAGYDRAMVFFPMQWDRSKVKLGNFSYQAVGRMKPGVTMQQVSTDLERLLPVANRSFAAPEGFDPGIFEKAHIHMNLRTLKKDVVGDVGSVLWVLMASIGLVLLVACANVANLLLVRVEGRRQELAVRSALGAPRGRITADLMFESLVLGVVGSVLGLVMAYGALKLLIAAAPVGLPRLHEIGLDGRVLLFVLGLALFVSLVIGAIPVVKYAGVTGNLKEGGRGLSQSRERQLARKTLVVVQVALALVLLICSGLMIRTFMALAHVSPGFADGDSLQTFRIYIPETQIPDTEKERVVRTEQAILDRLAAIPGVSSAAYSTLVPMAGDESNDLVYAQDHPLSGTQIPPIRRFKFVSPGLFKTQGTPLVTGRDFTWADLYQKHNVAIISENFAREYWQAPANAIGKRIRVADKEEWREVIGVATDVYDDGVDKKAPSTVYWPDYMGKFETEDEMVRRGVSYVFRTPQAGSQSLMREAERAVWGVNSQLPLSDPQTLGQLYTKSMARTSFTLVMLCVAGAMALLLGIVGIYGVISYAVSQRTREIGIRMALGAQRPTLTRMFVRQGLVLTGIGIVFGLGCAFAAMRLMASLLYQVSPMDPVTYGATTAAVLGIAYLACYLPSRRAASVNPVEALRSE